MRRVSPSGRAAMAAPLTAWLLLVALVALTAHVVVRDPALDVHVRDAVTERWPPARGTRFHALVAVAGAPVLLPCLTLVLALLVPRRAGRPGPGTALALVLVTWASVASVKMLVARPGPFPAASGETGMLGSYPSGHTTVAVIAYGLAAWLLLPPDRAARAALLLGPFLGMLEGVLLVLGGFHWASDVLGGWLLGTGLLVLATLLPRKGASRAVARVSAVRSRAHLYKAADQRHGPAV